jgi:hypothetical protein
MICRFGKSQLELTKVRLLLVLVLRDLRLLLPSKLTPVRADRDANN